MNKHKLYAIAKEVTPPALFNALVKSSLYPKIKRSISKMMPDVYAPAWKKIANGKLAGREVFVTAGSSIDDMFEKRHDDFMLEYITPGAVVLDIGAHIGSNAMFFADIVGPSGRVISFEPNPFNISFFERNLERNADLRERLEIVNLALSNAAGEEEFVFTDNVEGGTSSGSFIGNADTIWPKNEYEEKGGFKKMKVKTDTLDNYLSHAPVTPTIVKIDVEGAEYLVLEGATKVLSETRPIFLIEIHSIFNMFKVGEMLAANSYSSEIIKKEEDGRCFIVARPLVR